MEKLKKMLNNYVYKTELKSEILKYAKNNNLLIIMGASDDLCEIYGVEYPLTDYMEIDCDEGRNFKTEKNLIENWELQAKELELQIFWCGKCPNEKKWNYDIKKFGAFRFKVNKPSIEFKVLEEENSNEIYCTGLIVQL